MQTYADALGEENRVASDQSVALGAAILGAMAPQRDDKVCRPDAAAVRAYDRLYPLYHALARNDALAGVMHALRYIAHS